MTGTRITERIKTAHYDPEKLGRIADELQGMPEAEAARLRLHAILLTRSGRTAAQRPPGGSRMFGERLREYRKAIRLTHSELGDRTGVTSTYISLMERGQGNSKLDMTVKLAGTLQVETADLIRPR